MVSMLNVLKNNLEPKEQVMAASMDDTNPTDSHEQKEINYSDLSRSDVRSLIFHVLYAMESFNYEDSLEKIVENFNKGFDVNIPLDSQAVTVARACIEQRNELDELIKPSLHNWRFDRIGTITKLILRIAVWELYNTDTPPTVVINEAIELAKGFAEQDAYKFINGVLDEQVKRMAVKK